ncbi:MAG: tRNA (adenosine(37)-N6)-threonylcarbamoyltransferase complex ATPase subunit type 1 TsaE [Candidatus Izemoplasmatales bacterium]|nr:tRNA (adenosine(37)-N6)-threonylcarbamoyltransferase complex ATPase subunit type 1 TsaE [Candidatus Izemoplasmatales bacterium]
MQKTLTVRSLSEMDRFAKQIAAHLFPGAIIGLKGELGSGKTTLTKYLARHLGIQETVNSPTFTILKDYRGLLPLYHMDVYRLEGIGYDYELDDFIYGQGVSVIEWFPYISEMLPEHILEIEILGQNDQVRTIHVKGEGPYETIVQTLSD